MATTKSEAEALLPEFQYERTLNQDQAGRRIVLYGAIHSKPGILILERAPFSNADAYLAALPKSLQLIKNLGANDIYFWYMASSGGAAHTPGTTPPTANSTPSEDTHEDLKINLIYPCTKKHLRKYARQGVRSVTETPEIYASHIRPYMQSQREAGRLQWVWNIIEGKTEVEDVIYRTPLGQSAENEGFLLLPDLNWDRKTMQSLHLLGLVERTDIWSVRDLRKKHLPWLRHMREKFLHATVESYPELEEDQVKLYVHYQPTYYHFHIHIVHVALEAGATQATGKAIGLESIIEQLECMAGDEEAGMDRVSLTYTVGEESELWRDIFEPLKKTAER